MLNVYLRNANEKTLSALKALRHCRYKNITLWVNRSLATQPPIANWKDKNIIEDGVGNINTNVYEWDVVNQQVVMANYQVKCMLWHLEKRQMDFCVLDYPLPPKEMLVTFKDLQTDYTLPDVFQKVPCFCDFDTLINYCRKQGILSFSLKDSTKFLRDFSCNRVKGAEVYQELATGRLWYEDTFHRNHFEVFDPLGHKHIAEADINGVLDFSKADPAKLPIK